MEAVPSPQVSVDLVNRVPLPLVPLFRLVVYMLPRVGSFIWYVDPDSEVPMVTLPTKTPVPVPVSMPSHFWMTSPVVASVTTCSLLGVPSFWTPATTVSHARRGLLSAAQTTRRGAVSTEAFDSAASAVAWPLAAASFGVVERPFSDAVEARSTPLVEPLAAWWTTMSPPRTGSPL